MRKIINFILFFLIKNVFEILMNIVNNNSNNDIIHK